MQVLLKSFSVVLPDVGNAERRVGPHCPTHHGELAEEDAEEGGLTR